MSACTWDAPGADRYTGTVAAAITAYHLPIATQSALIAAWERREFTDTVVIDRDSIRGKKHEYEPELRSMHFGSVGRVCATVTRSGWAASHIETALVVCAGSECVAIPAVCTNVARITRRVDAETGGAGVGDSEPPDRVTPAEATAGVASDAPVIEASDEPAETWKQWPELPSPPVWVQAGNPAPTTPIPEPSTWALMLAGLGVVAFKGAKR